MFSKVKECYKRMQNYMKQSREHVLITALVMVLIFTIAKFGYNKFSEKKELEDLSHMEVIEIMSEMENSMAVENSISEIEERNESTSCSPEYLKNSELDHTNTSGQVNEVADDKLPEYSYLYPNLYVNRVEPAKAVEEKKIAYLTFDDGPSKNTLKILNTLEEKGAVATFFVLGSTMDASGEEALKKMVEMGCTIGIHTYSHKKDVIYKSVESFLTDFNEVYNQIYEITGVQVNIFRFPWGSYNRYCKSIKSELIQEMERRGFTYYDWNVSAEDSVGKPSAYSINHNILKDVTKYNNPVILMHDSMINNLTVQCLPAVIDSLKELGYTFDTLDHREPCQFCY